VIGMVAFAPGRRRRGVDETTLVCVGLQLGRHAIHNRHVGLAL